MIATKLECAFITEMFSDLGHDRQSRQRNEQAVMHISLHISAAHSCHWDPTSTSQKQRSSKETNAEGANSLSTGFVSCEARNRI